MAPRQCGMFQMVWRSSLIYFHSSGVLGIWNKWKILSLFRQGNSETGPHNIDEEAPKSTEKSTTIVARTKSKRRKVDKGDKRDKIISLACFRLRQPDDVFLNIGKTWAHELSEMDPRQQLFVKRAINDILFEGRCRTLQRNWSRKLEPIRLSANKRPLRRWGESLFHEREFHNETTWQSQDKTRRS